MPEEIRPNDGAGNHVAGKESTEDETRDSDRPRIVHLSLRAHPSLSVDDPEAIDW
jgi:hypothetical protein